MKRSYRQLLALLLSLVFAFSLLPAGAVLAEGGTAPEEPQEQEGLQPTDGETGDGEQTRGGDDPTGGDGQTGGADHGWYSTVIYGGTAYEIEFLVDDEGLYPLTDVEEEYSPLDTEGVVAPIAFGVVERSNPNSEDGERLPADPEIQALITDLSVSFTGTNEDGSALSSGIFSWNNTEREGTLSLQYGQGFRGTLTASFLFGGEQHSLSLGISWLRCQAYLTFAAGGAEMGALDLSQNEPLSGSLILHQWDAAAGAYTDTTLTSAASISVNKQGIQLSWDAENASLLTITAGEPGWFSIIYSDNGTLELSGYVEENGPGGDDPHSGDGEWYATVSYGGTEYEIEFFSEWGDGYGPYQNGGAEYDAFTDGDFFSEILFGAVTRDDPTEEWGHRTPAGQNIQDLITDLQFSFAGENEDGAPGQNWAFTPDYNDRKVNFSAPCKAGFSGTLTASFLFDGTEHTLSVGVFYLRCEAYLGFSVDGEEQPWLNMSPDTPLSGSLILHQWDSASGEYSSTTLTAAQAEKISVRPEIVQLSWDAENAALLTITPTGDEGDFSITFRRDLDGGWQELNLNGFIGSGGPGGDDPGGDAWYVSVNYGGTVYEIEFLSDWGNGYGPYAGGGDEYRPGSQYDFSYTILFGVVTRDDPDDDWSKRTLAAQDVQNLITELQFSFDGTNEDGVPGQNWTFTPDYDKREVTFSSLCKAGFSGMLTASFLFNGEELTVSADVFYRRCEAYLSFTAGEEELSSLYIKPNSPLSGSLVLHQWDGAAGEYTTTLLTSGLAEYFSVSSPVVELNWDAENESLVTVTPVEDEGWFWISYTLVGDDFRVDASIDGYVGNNDPNAGDESTIELRYAGETVTVGTGFMQSGSLRLGAGTYGDSFSPNEHKRFSWQFVLGGLRFYQDQQNETYATAGFFDRIESCCVELDLNSGTPPTVSEPVKVSYSELDDAMLYTFDVRSEADTPFNVTMSVTFTYREDSGELSTYTVRNTVFYRETTDEIVDASDLDTTAKLNAVLASRAALSQYLQEKGVDFAWEGTVVLDLPAVEYQDLIVCSVLDTQGVYGVALRGHTENQVQTTMHGLEDRGGLNFIVDMNFTANGVTQSCGMEEPFTCGVLVTCNGHAGESSIYGVDDCSFSGFKYAVRGTASGYQGSVMGCTITDCEYGVYVDCPDLNAAGNSELSWCTFIRCQDAIYITKLPKTITAYMYRIHDNIMIGCGRDINIADAGTFFCYGNFFGSDRDTRRTALLNSGESTRIIANPCRRSAGWGVGAEYWIDPALPTEILNGEAGNMTIDAEAFDEEQEINIDVVEIGESGLDLVGTWTFGGEGA